MNSLCEVGLHNYQDGKCADCGTGEVRKEPNPIRMFRIRHCWKRETKLFSATTLWGFRGNAMAALRDFIARNPHALSCSVLEEVR